MIPRYLQYTFIPYQSAIHSWKCTKTSYYTYKLYDYFTKFPTAKPQDAKYVFYKQYNEYIESIKREASYPWNNKTFVEQCSKIKKNIRNGNTITNPKRLLFEHHINKVLDHMELLFDSVPYDDVLTILNRYSKLQNYDLSWGRSIEAMKCLKKVLSTLTDNYKYKIAQKEKQTILSSITYTSNHRGVLNRKFLYELTDGKIKNDLIKKIGDIRWTFEHNEELYLYDKKFDHKYKTFWKVSPLLKKSMRNFWINKIGRAHV